MLWSVLCSTLTEMLESADAHMRILGVIAMIDDNETDWKVLTIAMDDDRSQFLGSLGDVLLG